LIDIISLARLFNSNTGVGSQLNGYTFHDTIIFLGYNLVRTSSLANPRSACRLNYTVHLGLMAFLTTFLLGFCCKRQEFMLLSELARSAAQGDLDEDEQSREVLLWTLFIGGVTIFSPLDDIWLIPRIVETTLSLGLTDWGDVSQTLSNFPWVNNLHDRPGEVLWQRSRCHRSNTSELQDCVSHSTGNSINSTIKFRYFQTDAYSIEVRGLD